MTFKEKFVKAIYRLQLHVSEGLLVASVLLAALIFVFFIFVRSQKLPNLAEILPADDTYGFVSLSIEDYLKSAAKLPETSPFATSKLQIPFEYYLGGDYSKLDFIADDLGFAYVSEQPVLVFKIKSKKKALAYMKTNLMENEELTENDDAGPSIYSYPLSHPESFAFINNLLVMTPDIPTLELIVSASKGRLANVESTADYKNLRSRLPYYSSGFAYINLPKTRLHIAQAMAKAGINEPGFMEAVFQLFPAFGATINMSAEGWNLQTFTAVDKSRIGGKALFRYDTKYEQNLLPYLPDGFLFEWGGHNLKAQVFRMIDLLTNLHSGAALIFESGLQAAAERYFGEGIDLDTEVYPLLDGEFLYAYGNSFILILGLDEGEDVQAYKLRDLFARAYQYASNIQVEVELDGKKITETQAKLNPITQTELTYEGHSYARWTAGEQFVADIAILDGKAIISGNDKDLFNLLDAMDGRTAGRSLRDYGQLLSGSDEISILHTGLIPDGNILRAFFDGFTSFATTRKVFDDGIFTRHSLLFK